MMWKLTNVHQTLAGMVVPAVTTLGSSPALVCQAMRGSNVRWILMSAIASPVSMEACAMIWSTGEREDAGQNLPEPFSYS